MEVVIKIPDYEYEDLTGLYKFGLDRPTAYKTFIEKICVEAIANGTPLPEGHGRLIDADKLDTRERGNNSQRTMWWNIDRIIKDAQTIVEADKENNNGYIHN